MDCQPLQNEIAVSLCQLFDDFTKNNTFQEYGILGLFINQLLSATALPLPTEPLTAILINGGESKYVITLILISASVIGGIVNYSIGFGGNKIFRRFRPIKNNKKEKKSHSILDKFGWAGIFFSPFILVIGDLILISAGARKMNFIKFMFLMSFGKTVKVLITVFGLGVLFT